jgi:hypothetical protein
MAGGNRQRREQAEACKYDDEAEDQDRHCSFVDGLDVLPAHTASKLSSRMISAVICVTWLAIIRSWHPSRSLHFDIHQCNRAPTDLLL